MRQPPAKPAPEPPATAVDATPSAGRTKPQGKRMRRSARARERGGPKGPEPTRYGDWERNGRCIDF